MKPLPLCEKCGKSPWAHGLRGRYLFCDVNRMVVDGRAPFEKWVVNDVRHTLGKLKLPR